MDAYKVTKNSAEIFQKGIYLWSENHPRPMPWKGEKDPYKIWVSEIILQQTRVEQGRAYYERFIKSFPTIKKLAEATIDKVLKLWEGLGYYSRARNLHETAKMIVTIYNGQFPKGFEEILQLKGIGIYTASAIAAFAFDLLYAVLDGNVHRIFSRYLGIKKSMTSSLDKKYFQSIADQFLDKKSSGKYNQAVMDFGAMCCLPKNPMCSKCPLRKSCFAIKNNLLGELPIPKTQLKKRIRYFHYFIIVNNNKIYVNKRLENDIWKGLYEFPLIETSNKKFPHLEKDWILELSGSKRLKTILSGKQVLSHQLIHTYFYIAEGKIKSKKFRLISFNQFSKLAFPVVIKKNRAFIKSQVQL
ncbi:MAG: A/G-specific adenine glycosylase [Saprospiraceae bacterium]